MAKTSGVGDGFYVNGYDLSGDTGAMTKMASTIGEQNVTGLNKSAMERLQLLGDGSMGWKTFFTGDASDSSNEHAHERLRTLSTTALCTYTNGTAQGNAAIGLLAKQFTYELTRGEAGDLFGNVEARASGGAALEIGRLLERDLNLTAAGNGTTLDLGASHGWLGAVFHLHVTGFTGTSCTILIQTDDNSGMSSPTTYGTFASVSGRTYERLVVASAPERYIRARVSAGTFSSVTFTIAAIPTF